MCVGICLSTQKQIMAYRMAFKILLSHMFHMKSKESHAAEAFVKRRELALF